MSSHSLEVSDGVADGIHSHVAHVQAARWVWKHREDVKLLPFGVLVEQQKLKLCTELLENTMKLHLNPETQ